MKLGEIPSNWEELHNNFLANRDHIWLNNCGTTPAGNYVISEVQEYLEDYSRHGTLGQKFKYREVRNFITQTIADLIKCSPEELAIVHNTAEGMNFVSHGLDLKSGDRILLMENEYPSNIYPFEHWEKKGIVIDWIAQSETPDEFLENFKSALHEKTKAVSLSFVHWCTGMPLPIAEIGEICRQKNILLIADGAQGVGQIPIDLQSANVDFMCFPAWKWLLGPLGLGILYVNSRRLSELRFTWKGQNSVTDGEYLPYRSELKGTERYEISTPNFTDWVYFQASLKMLSTIGWEVVMQRILYLSDFLRDALRKAGCVIHSDGYPNKRSCIVVAEPPNKKALEVYEALKSENIVCALRLGRLRFAPHVYISEDQLKKTAGVVGG